MTIAEYFEGLKKQRNGATPFAIPTAQDMENHFQFIEKHIKKEGLTVEEYLYINENLYKLREIKSIHGIEFYEQWKRVQNNTKKD